METLWAYRLVLGVSKIATEEEIEGAFRRLALKYHPDKGGDNDAFHAIEEAKTRLLDHLATQERLRKKKKKKSRNREPSSEPAKKKKKSHEPPSEPPKKKKKKKSHEPATTLQKVRKQSEAVTTKLREHRGTHQNVREPTNEHREPSVSGFKIARVGSAGEAAATNDAVALEHFNWDGACCIAFYAPKGLPTWNKLFAYNRKKLNEFREVLRQHDVTLQIANLHIPEHRCTGNGIQKDRYCYFYGPDANIVKTVALYFRATLLNLNQEEHELFASLRSSACASRSSSSFPHGPLRPVYIDNRRPYNDY